MKWFPVYVGCVLAVSSAVAGDPATNQVVRQVVRQGVVTNLDQAAAAALKIRSEAPNEIIGQKATYRGIAVQWKKTRKWWQLFNPFAPASFGRGDENLDIDPFTGKPQGFIILSISPRPKPPPEPKSP